jgi:DNA-binding NtrC family response regulator
LFSIDEPLEEALTRGLLAPELAVLRGAVAIHVPPLRQRSEDVAGLVAHFLAEHSRQHGRDLTLGPGASELLAHTEFPGNVAQLFAVLERCANVAHDGVLSIDELSRGSRPQAAAPHRPIAEHLDEREYQLVLQAVQRNPRRLDQAARELGVSRTTLWRRMRKYGIKLAAT